jgi:antitoxin (DNA-binding transcriptional repressor) of toxin-antitoxin stability system
MKTVGLKVLKNKLSEYVRIAASGETVLVTDRGRVVVEMNAPQPAHKDGKKESVIERGIREGWIRPAKVKGPLPPPPPPIMTLEELLEELDDSRADRDIP